MHADGDASAAPDRGAAPPQAPASIEETVRTLGAEARAGVQATVDAVGALRQLVVADIALARSALARTLALAGLAIAFAASSWLLLMATMIAAIRAAGLPWLFALLVAAVLSLAITAAAAWGAMRHFEHTRLQATRRQFARLDVGALLAGLPDAAATPTTDPSQAPQGADRTGGSP